MKIILAFMTPVIFLTIKILRKFDIPKATVSRARVIYKRIWDGPVMPDGKKAVTGQMGVIKSWYYLTFLVVINNKWHEMEFIVPKSIYKSFYEGDEGILKHDYTEFRNFEKFQ